LIILNASTLPAQLTPSFDNMSTYAIVTYSNKYQVFTFDYKNFGPLYYSLGNPFLMNNYSGISAQEKVMLLKRRLNLTGGFRNYSNNLNGAQNLTVQTTSYNGGVFYNPGMSWPSFMLNYLSQNRQGTPEIASTPGINDVLNNYVFMVNYNRKFWNLNHSFRVMANMCNRQDFVNAQNEFSSTNAMLGISEVVGKNINVSLDYGKAIINGNTGGTLSNISIYNFSCDWQIKPQKYQAGVAISNNSTLTTDYANASYRLSLMGKFGYWFYRGMRVDIESGYQPYVDQVTSQNNYSEVYGYVRYVCDLGLLTSGNDRMTSKRQ
jgi:hypothetical protein